MQDVSGLEETAAGPQFTLVAEKDQDNEEDSAATGLSGLCFSDVCGWWSSVVSRLAVLLHISSEVELIHEK